MVFHVSENPGFFNLVILNRDFLYEMNKWFCILETFERVFCYFAFVVFKNLGGSLFVFKFFET